MKNTLGAISCLLTFAVYASEGARYRYAELRSGEAFVASRALCAGSDVSVHTFDSYITLSSNSQSVRVDDLSVDPVEVIVGDLWGNRRCFVAVKVAQGQVNESYEVYDISRGLKPRKITGLTLINPDFTEGRVQNGYREQAKWNWEALCYSELSNRPYVCEVRRFVTDDLQSMKTCPEQGGCEAEQLVVAGTKNAATAEVVVRRAVLLDRGAYGFKPRSSYLIKGDSINLVGYHDTGDNLYFMFTYKKGGRKTTAWINSSDVQLTSKISR
ncbi:hypothetical protein [Lysobacter arvi]|uniref:SH3 domain-containing protein n=1 Tax=Lysobacter arvi TaxID=3038776 RepID=A0ABU1CAB2_9GAMM|nr:hypothetical protein [Lysobacter arvi]MDR0182131.1 hypothetical protein [Lysobacter arvi]